MGVKERQRLRQQAKHKKEQLDRLREQQNTLSADCEVLDWTPPANHAAAFAMSCLGQLPCWRSLHLMFA